jgi:hypothetical protein
MAATQPRFRRRGGAEVGREGPRFGQQGRGGDPEVGTLDRGPETRVNLLLAPIAPASLLEATAAALAGGFPATTRRHCGAWRRAVKVGPSARATRAADAAPLTARRHAQTRAEVEAGKALPGI